MLENEKQYPNLTNWYSNLSPKKDKNVSRGDKNVIRKDTNMWLDNLKELKATSKMSSKQIADMTNLPERTIKRIFSGDTDNPYVDTLHRIVVVLGGSLDDILADSKTVVGSKSLVVLQEEIDRLKLERDELLAENANLENKNKALQCRVDSLVDVLITKLSQ